MTRVAIASEGEHVQEKHSGGKPQGVSAEGKPILALKGAKTLDGFLGRDRAPASPQRSRRNCDRRQAAELEESTPTVEEESKPGLSDFMPEESSTPSTYCDTNYTRQSSDTPSMTASDLLALAAEDLPLAEPAAWPPLESTTFDVVGNSSAEHVLLPLGGKGPSLLVKELPGDAVVNLRVIRFFEDPVDEKCAWEKELHNVNSGSLLWLPVHMVPKMHSLKGCKYGEWFTIHHIQVVAKHFASGYQMCNEGVCPAKTFGVSSGVKALVTGKKLQQPYFWFVTPRGNSDKVNTDEHMQAYGWRHVRREGPFDGSSFLSKWQKQGSPLEHEKIQAVLQSLIPGSNL